MTGFDQATQAVIVTGGVAGALTACWILARRAYRAVREAISMQVAAGRIINAELTRNGGGSLLDKVNRIEGNHQQAQRHWEALEESQRTIVKRLEKIEAATSTPTETP